MWSLARRAAGLLLVIGVSGCSGLPPTSTSTPPPGPTARPLAKAPGTVLGQLEARALRREGGAFLADERSHSLRVESDGSWSLRPVTTARGRGRLVGSPLSFGRSTVARGTGESTPARVRDEPRPGAVAFDRGIAVERISTGPRGVEHSWTFAARPADRRSPSTMTGETLAPADLVVRVPAKGLDLLSSGSDGIWFHDPQTGARVRYGLAHWVDAKGASTVVFPRFRNGEIVMTVPAKLVDTSAYPAVLDPIVGIQIGVDAAASGYTGYIARVAYSPTADVYCVAWDDTKGAGVTTHFQLVSGTGALIGTNQALSTISPGSPEVGWDGTNFLLTWSELGPPSLLRVQRVSTTGALVDASPVTLVSDAVNTLGVGAIATNNAGVSLISFVTNQNASPYAIGMSALEVQNGALVGTPVVLNSNNAFFDETSSVASDGTDFLVTWVSNTGPQKVVGNLVTAATRAVGAPIAISPNFGFVGHAAFGAGTYFVIWEGAAVGSIEGGRVTPGTGATPDFASPIAVFNPGDTFETNSPVLTFDGKNFFAAFSHFTNATDQQLESQQITPSGTLFGGSWTSGWPLIGAGATGTGNPDATLGAASNGGGKTLVAYRDEASQVIRANLYTSGFDGAPCVTDGDCDNGHCVPNVPSGTGSTCCHTTCNGGACSTAQCSTGTCTTYSVASGQCGRYTACQAVAASCPAPADGDGDNLPDTWETSNNGAGQHYVDTNCDGTWESNEPLLPGASSGTADVYVTYDYMGLGLDDWSCSSPTDCTALGNYHHGESCIASKCVYSCTTTTDCTDGIHNSCSTPSDCGAGSFCIAGTCQRGAWHAGEQCLVNGSVTVANPLGTPCSGSNCVCYHTHDPEAVAPGALAQVITSFGTHGVTLHISPGARQPHSHVVSYRPDSAMDLSCEGASTSTGTVGIGKYAVGVYDLKPTGYPANSSEFLHYALFSHYVGCDTASHCTPTTSGGASDCPYATNPDGTPKNIPAQGQSGLAEISGNDLVVSLGGLVNDSAFSPAILSSAGYSLVGATFMHELGHNLGLRHDGHVDTPCPGGTGCVTGDVCTDLSDGEGRVCHQVTSGMTGAEQPNYKPNYISLMNYRYEPNGIQNSSTLNTASTGSAPTAGSNVGDPTLLRLDYSNQTLPSAGPTPGALVENNLDDSSGLGAVVDTLFPGQQLLFNYKDGVCDSAWKTAPATGSVDWETFNTTFNATGQAADVAALVGVGDCASSPSATLSGHRDWGSFVYTFQCNSTFGDGFAPIASFPAEPDLPSLSGSVRGKSCGRVGCQGPNPPVVANPSCASGDGCSSPVPAKVDIRPRAQNNWLLESPAPELSPPARVSYAGSPCASCGGGSKCFATDRSTFRDPTPHDGAVTGVEIELRGLDCTHGGKLKVSLNGVAIGEVSLPDHCACGGCQSYPRLVHSTGTAPLPNWVAGGDNTLTVATSNGNKTCLHEAVIVTQYRHTVPVVVYGSPLLDVTRVVPGSLRFGNAAAVGEVAAGVDLDGDGQKDLEARFIEAAVGLPHGATSGTVTGELSLPLGGVVPFLGSDVVELVHAPRPDEKCSPQGYSGHGGCWYQGALGQSCQAICAPHGGFNESRSRHTGDPIGKGFYPLKAAGRNWKSVECSSVDNDTDWGANGAVPDRHFSHPACHLLCSCME